MLGYFPKPAVRIIPVMGNKPTLRLPDTEKAYDLAREKRTKAGDQQCPLCGVPSLREFTYWRLVPNKFPYDKVAKTHHMLVPKRCVPFSELTHVELQELDAIKRELDACYHYYLETTLRQRSVPGHYHLHCIELGGPCSHPSHIPRDVQRIAPNVTDHASTS